MDFDTVLLDAYMNIQSLTTVFTCCWIHVYTLWLGAWCESLCIRMPSFCQAHNQEHINCCTSCLWTYWRLLSNMFSKHSNLSFAPYSSLVKILSPKYSFTSEASETIVSIACHRILTTAKFRWRSGSKEQLWQGERGNLRYASSDAFPRGKLLHLLDINCSRPVHWLNSLWSTGTKDEQTFLIRQMCSIKLALLFSYRDTNSKKAKKHTITKWRNSIEVYLRKKTNLLCFPPELKVNFSLI